MRDPQAIDDGRLLGLILRAASTQGGSAPLEVVERWAKLGPRFQPALNRLHERELIEWHPGRTRLNLTANARALVTRLVSSSATP